MKCFYHVNQDGIVSGYYVKKACDDRGIEYSRSDFRPINYGMKFPFEDIEHDELVFIVDYSIEPEEMWRLLAITKNVYWFDHHPTAIKKYKNFKWDVNGIRMTEKGISGANLTWWYYNASTWGDLVVDYGKDTGYHLLYAELNEIKNKCPLLAEYTADWDTFNFNDEIDGGIDHKLSVKALHYSFLANDFMPWETTLQEFEENIIHYIDIGYAIMDYENFRAERYIKSYGFETIFEGHRAFAVNSALISSDFFKLIDETEYDIFIGFSYKGDENKWEYQLRSAEEDKVNVAEIAVKHGGGGHFNAAGFISDKYESGV